MLELQADENHEDGMLAFSCHILTVPVLASVPVGKFQCESHLMSSPSAPN